LRQNEEAFFLTSTMTESDGSRDRPSPGYSELTSSAIQKMVCASLTLFSCASTMCYMCSSPYFVCLACARRCATRVAHLRFTGDPHHGLVCTR
jgi:hypothetical protein